MPSVSGTFYKIHAECKRWKNKEKSSYTAAPLITMPLTSRVLMLSKLSASVAVGY